MPAADAGFKIAARVSGRQLAAMAGVPCDFWAPAVSEVQTTERLADRVFEARRGNQRFLVYMEAYTFWNKSAPWSMLSKSGLLSERERLPTISVVYILRPRGHRSQGGQFRLTVEGEPTQQIWFREICLWQQEPQAWWDRVPGLMAPKLAFPKIDVVRLIGREQMKESKIIEEFQEEARLEGRLETRREDILQVLDARFGARAQAEFAPLLQSVTDVDRLDRLLRLAARSAGIKQFRDQFERI